MCKTHYTAWYRKRKGRTDNLTRQRAYQTVTRAAKDRPCADCGVRYPYYVMDFDHRPGETKLFNIGSSQGRSVSLLHAEIAKCDVVCANCHRARTWNETGRIIRSA